MPLASPFEQIRYEVEGPIATVTLNRPEKLNADAAKMGVELALAVEEARADDASSCRYTGGEGRGFCAGADISAGADAFDTSEGGPALKTSAVGEPAAIAVQAPSTLYSSVRRRP